jgi:hypothetical protein
MPKTTQINDRRNDPVDSTEELARAVERMHGGRASLSESAAVGEMFDDRSVWGGVVHVFDLEGHPTATRAYAWSAPIEGSSRRKFFAVLHVPPMDSPEKAVRAAMITQQRSKH